MEHFKSQGLDAGENFQRYKAYSGLGEMRCFLSVYPSNKDTSSTREIV